MDRYRWRPLIAAPLVLLLTTEAHAAELWGTGPFADSTIQSTEHFELRYHHNPLHLEGFEDQPVLDYVEQVNRLNLLLASPKNFSIAVQLDEVALWGNRYFLDGEEQLENDLVGPGLSSPWRSAYVALEKWSFTKKWQFAHDGAATGSGLELGVGDVYASFGRGIVLNLVKNTDIDIDTSIRGAKTSARVGDFEATLVSGLTNRQQISQDNPNTQLTDDVHHMVSGLRIEDYGLGPIQAGAHGVVYSFGRAGDYDTALVRYSDPLDVTAEGVTLATAAGGVDLFAEGDVIQYRSDDFASPGPGYAAYASGSFYPGKAVFLIEAKKSKDTERINTFVSPELYEVASIPTLEYERVITEDSSSTLNSNDLTGARVRMDYSLKPGVLTPYVSLAAFDDEDVAAHFNTSPEHIVHGIAGVQWMQEEWVLQVNAGYRVDDRVDADEGADRLAHTDGEVHFGVWGDDALELIWAVEKFQWGNNENQQSDFLQMSNALSYYRGDHWVFVLYQDYSDNELLDTVGNLSDHVYGAAEIQWKPGDATELRLFYGAYKDGIRCSGGQCRKLPGFDGARFTFNGRF